VEAFVTLLFFAALWGLARVLKIMARNSPEARAVSDALSCGEQKPAPPGQPPQAAASKEQQPTTTKPAL